MILSFLGQSYMRLNCLKEEKGFNKIGENRVFLYIEAAATESSF